VNRRRLSLNSSNSCSSSDSPRSQASSIRTPNDSDEDTELVAGLPARYLALGGCRHLAVVFDCAVDRDACLQLIRNAKMSPEEAMSPI
jgi:hypothetical protein